MAGGGRETAADPAAGSQSAVRICVGGLGESVTVADIEKTFSPHGRVASVEFARTKGRSLAFMDFEPASDRSLAKIFSIYNGCTWKGGKLRLEKAKEHYLARLKREWEEDARLVPTTPIDPIAEKDAGHLKTIESLNQKNMHLRIFFPKLRKVKSLPFKGTGKHKYSFQRIDVPSLPIHFCDCEEHYDPSGTTSQKQLSPLNKVMHEEEVRIMKSVMAKLLEKENNETGAEDIKLATHADVSNTLHDIRFKEAEAQATDDDNLVTNIGIGGSSEEHYDPSETTSQKQLSPLNKVMHEEEVRIMKSVMAKLLEKENNEIGAEDINVATHADVSNTLHDIRFTEEETQATDDDNLVTNIGIRGSSDILMTIRGKTRSTDQDSRYNKLLNSKDRSVPKKANSQERKKVGPSSLSKVTLNMVVEQITRDESPEISYENISTGGHSQKPDNFIKAPSIQVRTEQNMYNVESRKGNSWLQKSSWKDLVGEGTGISFSISNVLPGIDAMAPKVTKAGDFDTTIPTAAKKRKVQPEREKPKSVPIMPSIHLQMAPEPLHVVKSGNGDGNHTDRENGGCSQSQKKSSAEPKRTIPKVGISEVCPFMRSAESEKEWAKAKAALSGHIRKKSTEKDSSKSSKSMPSWKH